MAHVTLSFNARRPLGNMTFRGAGKNGARYLANFLNAAIGGDNAAQAIAARVENSDTVGTTGANASMAAAGIIVSGSSGNLTITVGTFVSGNVTAGSDLLAASALVAAVNANTSALRQGWATNTTMRFTVGSVPTAGDVVVVNNVAFTFRAAVVTDADVLIGGSTTATATNLAAAIQRHPSLALRYVAASNAAIVYIAPTSSRTIPNNALSSRCASVTATVMVPTLGTVILAGASVAGEIGNNVAFTGTGTGITVFTNGTAGRMGNGLGGATGNVVFDL